MNDYKTQVLLACLAVIVRRCGKAIVIADEDVERALDEQTEVMFERDHHAKCMRLTVPVEAVK
ncbi:MAG TPA: hypothetical protein VKX45_03380 [Bryobacteraceae bacterium]|jgi:hypothetical protein|nr:hypothetical protein [Bryobacteraceae bacterium]